MMLCQRQMLHRNETGFSLIEILVGLAIGLIVTLVISQTLIGFEGQKRTTTGNADAQTSGSIAMYMIQRQVQMAGYGIPIFTARSPMKCTNSNGALDVDGDPATATATAADPMPAINISPVVIIDGGTAAGASDTITVGRSVGDVAGLPVKIIAFNGLPEIEVDNNMGCQAGDVALVMDQLGKTCAMRKVVSIEGTTKITLNTANASDIEFKDARISCPGVWTSTTYFIQNGTLMETAASSNALAVQRPIMSNIVNLQAQYGLADSAISGPVTSWVDGGASAPTIGTRNRIRAVRLVIVARNDLLERNVVANAPCDTGICRWAGDTVGVAGTAASANITNDANWNRYRYRVFETIIPLRNMTWSKDTLL